ncbi:MAG: hypothetical protein HC851_24720 [Acaryochloris sp. RU_4_1]|nr:hypothetical protein [Acaryochloris sp. RU_4_1]NJR57315.1 hypothetical protein [Acaryochloris sp. CRU_2_0]
MAKQYRTEYTTVCQSDFPGQEPSCRPGKPYQVEVPPIETGIPGVTIPAGISSPVGFLSWDMVITFTILMLFGPTRRLILLPFRLIWFF